jgi:4-carboxymuconolactone decarboxylase
MSDGMNRSEKFERGLATRKAVLGADYVDQTIAKTDAFSRPFQQLATEYCWDEIWNRPGLDWRSRSILNLGILSALNRADEFKVHVRGSLANGVTKDEIQEICLQISIYCGMPAGRESVRLAREVFAEVNLD